MRPPTTDRSRTIFVVAPIIFMFFHQIVLNLAARWHFNAFLNSIDPTGSLFDLTDPAVVQQLQTQADIQSYASLYMSLFVIPIYVIYLWARHRMTKSMPSLERVGASDFLAGLSVITGSLGIVTLWMVFLHLIAERAEVVKDMLDDYRDLATQLVPDQSNPWIVFLALVILVPIAEELLFRGIVQGEMMQVIPEKWAIVVTLVLFSLFHMNPVQISYVIIPAFALSLVYTLTKNLFIPIVMHMWFNFVGSGFLARLTGDPEQTAEVLFFTQMLFILIGTFAAVHLYGKRKRARLATNQGDIDENINHF